MLNNGHLSKGFMNLLQSIIMDNLLLLVVGWGIDVIDNLLGCTNDVINRPGVAGAVLQTPLSLIH